MGDESASAVGAWCETHGVDAWFARNGDVGVATSEAQEARARELVSRGAPRRRPRSTRADGGPGARAVEVATVPVPASPALRSDRAAGSSRARAATGRIEMGVRIHEHTPVRRFGAGSRPRRDPSRHGAGGRRRSRSARGGGTGTLPPALMVRGHLHGADGAGARAPRGDRLDERGGPVRPTGRRCTTCAPRPTAGSRSAAPRLRVTSSDAIDVRFPYDETLRSASSSRTCTDCSRRSGTCRSRPRGAGRSTSRRGTCPSSARCRGDEPTTRSASPATAWRPATWRAHPLGHHASASGRRPDPADRRRSPETLPARGDLRARRAAVTHAVLRKDAREDRGRSAGPLTRLRSRHLPRAARLQPRTVMRQ